MFLHNIDRYIEIFRAKKSDVHNINMPKIRPLIANAPGSRPAPYDRRRGGRTMRGQPEDRYHRGRGYGRDYHRDRQGDYPGYGRSHAEFDYDRDREEYEDRIYGPPMVPLNVNDMMKGRDFKPSVSVVRMRGLPFKVTEDDILNFFDRIPLHNIHIDYGDDGRATGEAVVEFYNYKDALEAMKKDRHRIRKSVMML